jgi:hypothetical protein
MRTDYKFTTFLLLSAITGLILAWIDSRPGWDDSGITTGLVVLTAALFGFLHPERPWIWALAIGIWIPVHAVFATGDFKMFFVTIFAFIGAYLGSSVKNNKPADPE